MFCYFTRGRMSERTMPRPPVPPHCSWPFSFHPLGDSRVRGGEDRKPPLWIPPRCFLTGKAMEAEGGLEVYHQGPTLQKKQGNQPHDHEGMRVVPSNSHSLVVMGLGNNSCQSRDRHRDEKSWARALSSTVFSMLSLQL